MAVMLALILRLLPVNGSVNKMAQEVMLHKGQRADVTMDRPLPELILKDKPAC